MKSFGKSGRHFLKPYNEYLASVILPVFNGESYIFECIESVLNQTHTNLELIIIDDGSTDQTAKIIDGFSDLRIKRFKNNRNKGIVVSLNRALTLAKGSYIFRMDADDIMHPQRVRLQLQFMLSHKLDWSATRSKLFATNERANFPDKFSNNSCEVPNCEFVAAFLCSKNIFSHGAVSLRSSYVKESGLHYSNVVAEDLRLWVDLFKSGARMGYLNVSLYAHRRNPDGLYAENRLSINKDARVYHGEAFWFLLISTFSKRASSFGLYQSIKRIFKTISIGLKTQGWRFIIKTSLYLIAYLVGASVK